MADRSRGRRPVRLLIAVLAGVAFLAALRLSRTPHPLPSETQTPPVIAQLRSQLALTPVLAAEAALPPRPDDPQPRLRLADACSAANDPVGAALAIYPLRGEGVGSRGSGVRVQGSGVRVQGSGRRDLPEPWTLTPEPYPDLVFRYAGLCLEIGWLEEAAESLQHTRAVPPRLWLDLASAWVEHGQADRAVALLRTLRPDDLGPDEWLEGAICWYHCRRLGEAVRWARRAGGRRVPAKRVMATGDREQATDDRRQTTDDSASRRGIRPDGSSPPPSRPAAGTDASFVARGVLARCLIAAGQPEAALEALLTDAPGSKAQAAASDPTIEFWRGRAEARSASEALRAAGRERLAHLSATDPENGAAAFEAGRSFLLAGRADRAVDLLSHAAVSGCQEVLAYELLSRAYAALGQRPAMFWARGRSLTMRGQFSEAATAFRRSLDLDPSKPMAYVDLARALDSGGKVQEAVAVLQRAQKTVPGNLDVSLLKARLLLHMERVPDVVRELEAAAALDPRRANEPLGNLGTVYFDSQQYDRAVPPLERAVQVEDADAHSHFYLGRIYARELEEPGRAEKAVAHLLRAAQLQPDYSRPWMAAASVLQRMGYLSEASACLRRAIGGEPQSDASYVRLGQILQRQGRLSERGLILRRYAAVRDHDLTRTTLEKQTRDNPKDAQRRFALGDLLLREGRPNQALPELLVAVGLRPEWKAARARLADACALLGFDDLREEAEGAGDE